MARKNFRSRVREMRPDIVRDATGNELKRKLALALRALRKKKGMTQKDVERHSTLTQPMISRLEAPTGSLPNWETVMRYVEACGGHMLVSFSAHEFSERSLAASKEFKTDGIIAAVAV